MSGLITYCRTCGAEYEIYRADVLKGSWWWTYCPECRPAKRPEPEGENEREGADAA